MNTLEKQLRAAEQIVGGINALMQNPFVERVLSESEIALFNKLRTSLESAIRKSKQPTPQPEET